MRKAAVLAPILVVIIATISAIMLLSPPTGAQTTPIYVKHGCDGDGTSWMNAYGNLQDALHNASNGDQIWVAAGIYTPVRTGSEGVRTDSFQLKKGVVIYGGFEGTEASLNERDCQVHPTILSGEIGNPGTITDNCYHVFHHPQAIDLGDAGIDGCTITGGYANGTDQHSCGGGISTSNNSPAIMNCTFFGNNASFKGGAVYNNQSATSFINCVFYDNAAQSGGAIYNDNQSSGIFTNCTIFGNRAIFGGGIANINYSLPVITNCILWGNTDGTTGNQIYNEVASPYISYSNVEGGWAGPGNISGTPLFQNTGIGDFHLLTSSPGIDVGDNSAPSISGVDFEGNQRIVNGTVDIGADEFTQSITFILSIGKTGNGLVSPLIGDHIYNQDEVVNITASDSGCWQFEKWIGETVTVADVNDRNTTIIMDHDYSISAKFRIRQSNLILIGGPGVSLSPYEGVETHNCGDEVQLNAVSTSCCYEFVSWLGDIQYLNHSPDLPGNAVTIPEVDTVLSVQTEEYLFHLIVNNNQGGSVSETSSEYPCYSTVDIEAIPDNCYEFALWTGDTEYLKNGSGMGMNAVTIQCDDVELTADFARKTVNLSTSSTSGGSIVIPGEGIFPYICGTQASIVAVASPNYHFSGWKGSGTISMTNLGLSVSNVIMNDNYSIVASFEMDVWNPLKYDIDLNGKIKFREMIDALREYLKSHISYPQMIEVIMLYLRS